MSKIIKTLQAVRIDGFTELPKNCTFLMYNTHPDCVREWVECCHFGGNYYHGQLNNFPDEQEIDFPVFVIPDVPGDPT